MSQHKREIMLDDFVNSKGYKLFIEENLDKAIDKMQKSILQVDKEKNEVKYTEHDLERMVLKQLKKLRENIYDECQHIQQKYG